MAAGKVVLGFETVKVGKEEVENGKFGFVVSGVGVAVKLVGRSDETGNDLGGIGAVDNDTAGNEDDDIETVGKDVEIDIAGREVIETAGNEAAGIGIDENEVLVCVLVDSIKPELNEKQLALFVEVPIDVKLSVFSLELVLLVSSEDVMATSDDIQYF